MKIKLSALVLSVFLLICVSGSAQEFYSSAVGLRLGYPASISYKAFISDQAAQEGYVGLRSRGFGNFINISGAYCSRRENNCPVI